jgi:hypothetical protein
MQQRDIIVTPTGWRRVSGNVVKFGFARYMATPVPSLSNVENFRHLVFENIRAKSSRSSWDKNKEGIRLGIVR